MNLRRSVLASIGLSLALVSQIAGALQAQAQQQTAPQQAAPQANRATITGIVKDAATGAPLALASVVVTGTALGSTTGPDGRYTITNVPPGIVGLTVQRISYSPTTVENLRVAAGVNTRDVSLSVQALILGRVVATGLTDPGSGTKAPFSVASVGPEKLQVSALNSPLEALSGKVASLSIRGGATPGSDVNIQIRNPLSITGFTQPLIIIDGVIQMQDDPSLGARAINGDPLNLNGENIESIEVVRGAAAAALYGQRAANGVISITTKKGTDLTLGSTRMTLSNEVGGSFTGKTLPISKHHYRLVDENNQFIDAAGRPIAALQTDFFVSDPDRMVDNEWGVPIYDNVAAIFRTGYSLRNSLQLSQNTLSTNFSISGLVQQESGVIRDAGGASNQNVALNLDYRAGSVLSSGMGVSYNRRYISNLAINPEGTTGNSNAFLNAQNICKCVNILAKDPVTGDYIPHPDGGGTIGGLANGVNPLYFETHRDEWDRRAGLQVNGNATYRPSAIFSIRGEAGYNRNDREEQLKWVPVGTLYDTGAISQGEYDIATSLDELYNGRVRGGILTGLGGWTVRANLSTGGEFERRNSVEIIGDTLGLNLPDYDFIRRFDVGTVKRDKRTVDYSANIALDYNQKYVVDLVYRNDGSSLLPKDTRFNSNGRASAAWAMSEEAWWPLANFTLFKPRYSIGTAGNNPTYEAQFELYEQRTGSGVVRVTKNNLGNATILPEEVTEQEFGLDMAWQNRYSVSFTYVTNKVKNQIRPDTVLAFSGFDTQQANLGTIGGHTYEATLEAQWIQKRNFQWSSTLVMDHSKQKILSYPHLCDTDVGNVNTAASTYQRYCTGFVFGQIYGRYHVTDRSELSPRHINSGKAETHFDINDEGLVVAVGEGGSWTDGKWGTIVEVDGINYGWGMPLYGSTFDADGFITGPTSKVLGNGLPDFSFGFGNQVQFGKYSLSAQTEGQIGGKIFNQAKVRAMNRQDHVILDQFGKPDYKKKPIDYYIAGENCCDINEGNWGGLTSDEVLPYPRFMESGSYLKMTELRVAYRIDQGLPVLRKLGMTSASFALIGRNLFTITPYSGYDPKISNTDNTSGRVDRAAAPNYRSLAAQLRLTF
jgi:TonB-linked SusC/RagA family outer membrane protein